MEPTLTGLRFARLLLTGAAGGLGRVLRPRLKAICGTLRVSDIAELGAAAAGEELVRMDLADKAGVLALLQGVDAVVHLGGVSTEHAFETILPANIVGTYHVYEGARQAGTRRIVFASSNHVTGFYRQSETITPQVLPRPDTYYGLSKAFGENLAQFYFDRHGIETVSLRIGSSFPAPRGRRGLSSYLSYDDLERLVVAALTAPVVGHTVIYGVSANRSLWWDNRPASHLGFTPRDSSEPWRAELEAAQPHIDHTDPVSIYQGGPFVTMGPF
ncbi:MAG: NAD(P)-dependent oxidoreductase [Rubrivivax sp.]|nr:NAD(P)-dependent oxidoreductase [Rubrivivax sp.]